MNGLGSQCIAYRRELCERFVERGYRVVRYDNRDVGLSSKTEPSTTPYTLSDMAKDGIAVLDAIGAERAHVAGASMGGMIVQTMAIEHPQRLWSMTSIMSTTGEHDVGQSSPAALELLLTPGSLDRDEYVEQNLRGARTWGSPAAYDEERITANALEAFERGLDPAGVGRQLKAVRNSPSRVDGLRSVTTPTLVLHGDADTLIDVSGGRRTAQLIPGARLVVIEGMGHDYPPPLWDRLVALIDEHASGSMSSNSDS